MGRSARHLGTALTLAGLVLLAGCSMPLGAIPASEPNQIDPKTMSDSERGLFAGMLFGKEVELPPAVPVPMREATIERGFVNGLTAYTLFQQADIGLPAARLPSSSGALTMSFADKLAVWQVVR